MWRRLLDERLSFPDQLVALSIGDALHNLCFALYHLACACAISIGKTPERTQFPSLLKKTELERKLKKSLGKGGPVDIDLVCVLSLPPIGNPKLVALHELDIADRQRLILPVAYTMGVTIQVVGFEGKPVVTAEGAPGVHELLRSSARRPRGLHRA